MSGVKIEVEVDRPGRAEHPVDLGEALVKERQVLREGHVVAVGVVRDHLELVEAAGETLASFGAGTCADGAQLADLLRPERGVDVNEVDASVRQRAQDSQVIVQEDTFQLPGPILRGAVPRGAQRGRHWGTG